MKCEIVEYKKNPTIAELDKMLDSELPKRVRFILDLTKITPTSVPNNLMVYPTTKTKELKNLEAIYNSVIFVDPHKISRKIIDLARSKIKVTDPNKFVFYVDKDGEIEHLNLNGQYMLLTEEFWDNLSKLIRV